MHLLISSSEKPFSLSLSSLFALIADLDFIVSCCQLLCLLMDVLGLKSDVDLEILLLQSCLGEVRLSQSESILSLQILSSGVLESGGGPSDLIGDLVGLLSLSLDS